MATQAVGVAGPGGLMYKRLVNRSKPLGGGARGVVRGFSEDSRARLLRILARVDWAGQVAHFVTLTYHLEWEGWQEWKADLKAWEMRLARRYGDRLLGWVWKLEPQQRGAPHYHLVIFWRPGREPQESSWRRWAMASWTAIVAPGDREHLAHGCKVQRVKNTTGPQIGRLMRYLAKYLGKVVGWVDRETGEVLQTGRIWGVWGELPEVVVGRLRFSLEALDGWLQRIREWGQGSPFLEGLGLGSSGALIFGDGGELVELAIAAGATLDVGPPGTAAVGHA